MLVGNKSDLTDKREVTYDEGAELAKFYGITFLETSAKETTNISECFSSMAKTVIEKLSKNDLQKDPSDMHISDVTGNRREVKNRCC